MRLITHNGTFHADEVLATAILTGLFPSAEIVRTRDEAVIASAAGEDVVFDVGSVYSHAARRYDHHMVDAPRREDGSPYSSVGLIWLHYGMEYLEAVYEPGEPEFLAKVWKEIDDGIVRETDLLDNGVGTITPSSLPAIVDDFNPEWDDPLNNRAERVDTLFRDAVQLANLVFVRRLAAVAASERASMIVKKAAAEAEDPRIVVLPASMPWESALFEGGFGEALYVVYPKSEDAWYCSAVPPEPGSFAQRKPLPAEWAGLRGDALAEASGVPDATFCHPALFVCGARSREGVVSLARAACEAKPVPVPGPRP